MAEEEKGEEKKQEQEKKEENPLSLPINSLQLKVPPLCAVRKSTKNGGELPISFYRVNRQEDNSVRGSYLRLFSVYYRKREIYYYIIRTQNKEQKEQNKPSVLTFSFNFGLGAAESIRLDFIEELDNLDINPNSLKCYFKLHNCNINNDYCHKLPEDFNKRFRLHDLFEYKNDYYWSASHKDNFPKEWNSTSLSRLYLQNAKAEENVCPSNLVWDENKSKEKPAQIGERIMSYKCNRGKYTVFIDFMKISDKSDKGFEKQINQLVKRSLERFGGKMNELEVLALQYILVRNGIFVADIKYGILYQLMPKNWKKIADTLQKIMKIFK